MKTNLGLVPVFMATRTGDHHSLVSITIGDDKIYPLNVGRDCGLESQSNRIARSSQDTDVKAENETEGTSLV